MRSWPLVVVAVTVASALVGCGGSGTTGPATNGPLNSGTSIHSRPHPGFGTCVPGGRAYGFGTDQFTNYGHTTVVLDRVVLLHPHNERLIGSDAVPGDRIVGTAYWPVRNPVTQSAWKDRKPIDGFRLGPGKTFNMVLGIAVITAHRLGMSQGELVYYHDSWHNYVAKSYMENDISANSDTRHCP
jgi:hypothetical protein